MTELVAQAGGLWDAVEPPGHGFGGAVESSFDHVDPQVGAVLALKSEGNFLSTVRACSQLGPLLGAAPQGEVGVPEAEPWDLQGDVADG